MFRRVALLGSVFTTDELLAASGADEPETYAALEAALATVGRRARRGRLPVPPCAGAGVAAVRVLAARTVACRAPGRRAARRPGHARRPGWPTCSSPRAIPAQALPYARPAIETAGALGAYRDGLALLDAVVDHASGTDRAHLLARRGDLLMALADPSAVDAYRAALSVTSGTEHRLVRARLARAATYQGDFETAEVRAREPRGSRATPRTRRCCWRGGTWPTSPATSRRPGRPRTRPARLLQPGDTWQIIDLVGLQGLIAHQRGEWFQRFLRELRRTQDNPGLATAVFDAHLCVAEYLLYGPIPYDEVIELAAGLRRRAEQHGALRGVAFATALIGEAALLKGDLDLAERELAGGGRPAPGRGRLRR